MLKLLKKINRIRIEKLEVLGRQADKKRKGPKAIVLTYHRVTSISSDPLFLAVTSSNFNDQIRVLKNHFDIISTTELISRLHASTLKGNELVITFDDGYLDNLTEALPVAISHNVPLTIFISTGVFTSPDFSYPWDSLYSNTRNVYVTEGDIRTLSKNHLVTIGAHTNSHPRLRDLSAERQKEEMIISKQKLESITNSSVKYLAYPYGGKLDFTKETARQAKLAGLDAAFAMGDRIVTPASDLYAIPRINVRNWTGEELVDKIKQYL